MSANGFAVQYWQFHLPKRGEKAEDYEDASAADRLSTGFCSSGFATAVQSAGGGSDSAGSDGGAGAGCSCAAGGADLNGGGENDCGSAGAGHHGVINCSGGLGAVGLSGQSGRARG